jgi:hypothetical protein
MCSGYEEEVMLPAEMENLEKDSKWKLVELSDEKLYTPGQDPDITYRVWAYQVL